MRNTIHISSTNNNIRCNNNVRPRSNTVTEQIALPTIRKLQRSFLLCLLLLLSICSATDSFQLFDRRSNKKQQHRITLASPLQATSIAHVSPLIGVYGGEVLKPSSDSSGYQQQRQEHQHRRKKNTQRRRRRRAKAAVDDVEYQQRKQEWADRYTTLEGLRETFGSNHNKLYGDLNAATTRRLYKSLLPTAVCELVLDVEVKPDELAQLAYEARKAAKLYARERCHLPARCFANCYDGVRSFRRYGRFQIEGMSYDQIFDKYYQRSAQEHELGGDDDDWDEEDIVTQTCMKILESACRTNAFVDRIALSSSDENNDGHKKERMDRKDLEKIAQTLEDDVQKLLDPYNR
mmetsp:Transcript_7834/g.16809  ORF Transcript_7834/g.16809 Transcript_7834/m.16809 type:complete len:348 (+) Transcript_7834:208-1251(+)